MVGIVIVSHSKELAQGVLALAGQMGQGRVALAAAGGIDDPEQPIGTDPMKVMEAIEQVYSEDGVVVLMDLGSALMSAETAVEFLDEAMQANIFLSAAPLVEGAVAAVVQAAAGGSPAQVMAEARGALAAKLAQLGETETPENQPINKPTTAWSANYPITQSPNYQLTLTIQNKLGLHARPAAKFVGTANRFSAEIMVYKGDKAANAKSMNQVATLGVRQGDEIRVTAVGEDAQAALDAVQALADDNWGDPRTQSLSKGTEETAVPAKTPVEKPAGSLVGIAASPGIALGPVFIYRPQLPKIVHRPAQDAEGERRRLETAVHEAQQELRQVTNQMSKQVGAAEAGIFEAHRLILADPDLSAAAREMIFEEGVTAEYAWQDVVEKTAEQYRQMDDAYMQARAADVLDAGGRVLRRLVDVEMPGLDLAQPVILAAEDLTPSDTANLDPARILGVVTELGGATAHSAILARALGIPAVVGVGSAVNNLAAGEMIGLDGEQGLVYIDLDEAKTAELEARREAQEEAKEAALRQAQGVVETLDGHRVEIVANIGGLHDAQVALDYGAEGVGLFRTEFLFLGRPSAPTEDEQFEVYKQVAAVMGERPLIVRTLDIGGDKPLPYLAQAAEANPFLGLRGIRFCLANPEIFKAQLRAILKASPGHNIKLMFPMIGSVAEIQAAKKILEEVRVELDAVGTAYDGRMEVGMMIEVPSAVAVADLLAREVDFFSIGTNDLTQYVMAADRGNAAVAGLVNAMNTAVLRMIRQTVIAGHEAGIWVGLCGELGGNPDASALLVGLGLDELSMNAPSIPAVKARIRELEKGEAEKMAGEMLGNWVVKEKLVNGAAVL